MSLHGTLRDSTLGGSALRDPALPPQTASDASVVHSVAKKPLRHRSAAVKRSAGNGLWLSIGTVIILVAVWWAVTALQLISPLFLPAPQQVLHQLRVIASAQGFMDATLWQHLSASLGRILVALFAAVALGVPTGIAMGLSRRVRAILDPLIEIYRPVPPLAYLPLMVIWFGIGETSKILLIYLAIFAPVTLAAVAGVRSVAQVRVRAARALGASRWQVLRFVVLPSALPEILTGIRIGLGVGWSTLVAAELIAATRGLGFMVQSAGEFLATDVVIAGISVIAIIAFGMELSLRAIQRRLTPWYGAQQ
ncbi:taurine transporter subunit [Yersinia massiliensis]|uniref:taurine ABC transporter permease TauC n=1 Tax=Yersinia massiliensis TaxID=419257 RepID=UPI0005E90DD8|nr:taurine ABC transporter permease TauC [Yersinia massiliensis]CNI39197.1 taurine transporter subunit [Yersinia massiliensis]